MGGEGALVFLVHAVSAGAVFDLVASVIDVTAAAVIFLSLPAAVTAVALALTFAAAIIAAIKSTITVSNSDFRIDRSVVLVIVIIIYIVILSAPSLRVIGVVTVFEIVHTVKILHLPFPNRVRVTLAAVSLVITVIIVPIGNIPCRIIQYEDR